MAEKACETLHEVYMAFLDSENAFDRIDRKVSWKVLKMYGMGSKLLNSIESLYENNVWVKIIGEKSDWFEFKQGLKWGCGMSQWSFNIFMDCVLSHEWYSEYGVPTNG